MASDDLIEMEGSIVDTFRGGMFKVITDNEVVVMCRPSGKMRVNRINLVHGDKVLIQVSPYDLTKGRIVRRLNDTRKAR
jgi:translation initiation factor IF-1